MHRDNIVDFKAAHRERELQRYLQAEANRIDSDAVIQAMAIEYFDQNYEAAWAYRHNHDEAATAVGWDD
jgi:hypothetical protein